MKISLQAAIILLFFISISSTAQMVVDGDSLVGNEWIDYSQDYYKIKLHEDGIYHISYEELISVGIDLTGIEGRDLQLYRLGSQVPIFVSSIRELSPGDFIEFYGVKNRGELDAFLYDSPDHMLNPDYSLVNDTSSYFLSWKDRSTNRRFIEIANQLDGTLPDPIPFYNHSEFISYNDAHYKPTEQGGDRIRYSNLVRAEGYSLKIASQRTLNIPADHVFTNDGKASFRIRFGVNKVAHQIQLNFNGTMYEEYNLANTYKVFDDSYEIPLDQIKSSNEIKIQGFNGAGDKVLVSQVELIYPREYDFNGASQFRWTVEEGRFRRYIEIENFNAGSEPILLDLKNNTRRIANVEDGKVKINVEARNNVYDFILFNPAAENVIKSVTSIKPIVYRDFTQMDHDYVIISSEKLFNDAGNGGANWVQEYAEYRATTEGGSFNPIVVTAEELYDQFGYGVDRHFISVNNFANHVKKTWPSLEYFFVIGKGIEYQDYRTLEQQESVLTAPYFVPAWGNPGSDNLLFAEKGKNYALRPVGRISVNGPSEVELYLNKVKLHEANFDLPQTIDDKYWTKKIMHLSGGGKPGEQNLIRSYLQQMENVISDEKFGAEVRTFEKSSADPLQNATSDEIINLIDSGISLITFFGHSAVGTFDFSLEDPSKYQNALRLPMIVSLGCYSGNIFVPSKNKGLSEAFVLEPEVGAIAFGASSGTAYISAQGNLGNNFYNILTEELYGESIGKALRNMFLSLNDRTSIGYVTLLQQFTYHGDPALRLVGHDGPDYVIDYGSIRTEPEVVSTADIKYDIIFDVVNLGSVSEDSITIALEHILPDGSVADTVFSELRGPRSRSEVKVSFANIGTSIVGENFIKATVDVLDNVSEIPTIEAESNNTLDDGLGGDRFAYYVVDNAARPLFPREYGIAVGEKVTLQASTSNVFTPKQNYIIEIDTSELFEAPLEQGIVNAGGGTMEWVPTISLESNKVYYWRITPERENPVLGRLWNGSSFIYLPNSSEGWNQSHYFQYADDENKGVGVSESRSFVYNPKVTTIEVVNGVYDPTLFGYRVNLGFFASSIRPWDYQNQGIAITVLDTVQAVHVINNGGDFNSINTNARGGLRTFSFNTDTPENRFNAIKFIEDEIPDGYYVSFYTILKSNDAELYLSDWESDSQIYGTNLIDVLNKQGAENTDLLLARGTVPYVFLFRKNQGKIDEAIAETKIGTAKAFMEVNGRQFEGQMKSTIVGPAIKWDKILWQVSDKEINDTIELNVSGITQDGVEVLLFPNVKEFELDLKDISAMEYPYMRIEYKSKDEANRTVPNLNFWRVLFDGLPEVLFDNSNEIVFYNDTLNQGEELIFKASVENLSEFSMDSLLVEYAITDQKNTKQTYFRRYERVEKDDPAKIDFSLNTKDLLGTYQFTVELNPNDDQFEEYHFNNLGVRTFEVVSDKNNPLLDVTFDGVHIMDGDIVSAKPEIVINLEDDNQFFLIDNAELFEIKLDTGDFNALLTIPVSSPEIEFIPGVSGNNKAQIIYRPNLKDGFYTLYVQGRDASNNFSGDNEYSINFRVIDKKSISNVFNYPNPFSTRTQFVFTLTGEVPETMKLQIMTMSGKVVREITKEELGNVHVGVNRTDYWWDGTDEYGDKLGNGVYIYRLITKSLDGNSFEKFNVGQGQDLSDSFFKDGFGKMVIIR